MSFLLSLLFSPQQNRRRGWKRFCLEEEVWGAWGLGKEMAQTMYTHVNKCESDKIKGEF
jgi:hypothetical protein